MNPQDARSLGSTGRYAEGHVNSARAVNRPNPNSRGSTQTVGKTMSTPENGKTGNNLASYTKGTMPTGKNK